MVNEESISSFPQVSGENLSALVIPHICHRASLFSGIPHMFNRESILVSFQRDTRHQPAGMTNGRERYPPQPGGMTDVETEIGL